MTEETKIAFEEETQVVDTIPQHGQPVRPHPESKAGVALGIDAAETQHVGVHHSAARDFQPAALQRATHESHIDFGRRLGEREEGGTEAHLQVVAFEEAAQKICNHALEVGKTHRLADPHTFDLMEHRRVGRIGIDAIDAARRNHAQLGHRLAILVGLDVGLHGADLDRAGVSAEHHTITVLQVERIVHRTGRVIGRRVQCREIVEIGLDLGAFGHIEANGTEELLDFLLREYFHEEN